MIPVSTGPQGKIETGYIKLSLEIRLRVRKTLK